MVSFTQHTDRRRALRAKSAGRLAATKRAKLGTTPRFPIHPEGYDPNAADAKPVVASAAAKAGSAQK